jgi:hypothetical protein
MIFQINILFWITYFYRINKVLFIWNILINDRLKWMDWSWKLRISKLKYTWLLISFDLTFSIKPWFWNLFIILLLSRKNSKLWMQNVFLNVIKMILRYRRLGLIKYIFTSIVYKLWVLKCRLFQILKLLMTEKVIQNNGMKFLLFVM